MATFSADNKEKFPIIFKIKKKNSVKNCQCRNLPHITMNAKKSIENWFQT